MAREHDAERIRVISLAVAGQLTPIECVRRLRPIANAERRDALKQRRSKKVEREEQERIRREREEIRRLKDEYRAKRRDETRRIRRYEDFP